MPHVPPSSRLPLLDNGTFQLFPVCEYWQTDSVLVATYCWLFRIVSYFRNIILFSFLYTRIFSK